MRQSPSSIDFDVAIGLRVRCYCRTYTAQTSNRAASGGRRCPCDCRTGRTGKAKLLGQSCSRLIPGIMLIIASNVIKASSFQHMIQVILIRNCATLQQASQCLPRPPSTLPSLALLHQLFHTASGQVHYSSSTASPSLCTPSCPPRQPAPG